MNTEFKIETTLNRTEVATLRGLVGAVSTAGELASILNKICDDEGIPYVYLKTDIHKYQHMCMLMTQRKRTVIEVYEDELEMIESMVEVFK